MYAVSCFLLLALVVLHVHARPTHSDVERGLSPTHASSPPNCFPAIGFRMPSTVPTTLDNWWCDYSSEYAFVGFSYEVTDCQSVAELQNDFTNIRNTFNGRYVRIYGFCDRSSFYDDVVNAAWRAGVGVHALIWFGFDGDNLWQGRRDALFQSLSSNAKAKFVTRAVQFGSEPLFDKVLPEDTLAQQIKAAKQTLSSLRIPVTISELAYGYQEQGGAQEILNAIDIIDAHMLPFFSAQASTASKSWPLVVGDLNWFVVHGNGKKIYLTENGWPSRTSEGVQPNSPQAVANVENEQAYYALLDQHCSDFKAVAGGGVGWFAHIYSEDMEPGYGIYGSNGALKFPFRPRTSC